MTKDEFNAMTKGDQISFIENNPQEYIDMEIAALELLLGSGLKNESMLFNIRKKKDILTSNPTGYINSILEVLK